MWKIPKVKKETEKRGRDEQVYNQVHTDEQVYNQVHTGLNELLRSLNLFPPPMLKIPKVEKKSKKIGRDKQVYNQLHTDEQVYNQVHTGLNELPGSLNLFYHQCGRDEQVYNQVHTDEQVYNQVHTGLNELLRSLNLFPPPMLKIPNVKKEREKKR